MVLTLTQSVTALAPKAPGSFLAVGGTEPYTYSVVAGGAGGTIVSNTGMYTAPNTFSSEAGRRYDTILVTDDDGATATAQVLIGPPLLLFCEIIQRYMGLANGRVYIWDQKINQPKDNDIYIAVAVSSCHSFGASKRFNTTTNKSEQFVSMRADLDVNIISRGPGARDRKEEIILAVNSDYSVRQQDINSFWISKRDNNRFINLSNPDGAAIPYRFMIGMRLLYSFAKDENTEYFDDFSSASVITNS